MLQSFIIVALGLFLLGCSNSPSDSQAKVEKNDMESINNSIGMGKTIFYNYCTPCHNPINKYPNPSPPTSQITLYDMYKEKITTSKLQSSLMPIEYHSHLEDLRNKDSIYALKDFIWQAYSPRY